MFELEVEATSGSARTGRLALPHGTIETPCFMPVGTQGTVRALSPNDLRAAGADVAMAFDHVVPGVADETTARDALERTLRWLERCGKRHRELVDSRLGGQAVSTNRLTAYPTIRQTLWPILQGGTHLDLRTEGLRRILELGVWSGLAVGGLLVGEPKPAMYEMLAALEPRLPPPLPRYLIGVGLPLDLVAAGERGMDLFAFAPPTRHRRHGTAFTPARPANIRNAAYREDARPLDHTR